MRFRSKLIKSWEDFRFHFYNWLDDFYHYPEERERIIQDEIVPTYAEHVTAFLAAAVHHLCRTYGLETPAWVMHPKYVLKDQPNGIVEFVARESDGTVGNGYFKNSDAGLAEIKENRLKEVNIIAYFQA